MTESSEKLKKLLTERGIKWETQYGNALEKLVNILDTELAEAMLLRSAENAETIIRRINNAEDRFDETKRALANSIMELQKKASVLQELVGSAQTIIDTAKKVSENTITDAKDAKTLMLYKSLLTAGKEVFGEERMTDSSIASICESASYIVWRTVMGPKFDEQDDVKMFNGRRGARL